MPLSFDEQQQQQNPIHPDAAANNNLMNPYPFHPASAASGAGNFPVPLLIQTKDNARKRQRRQTAGNLVMGALFRTDSGNSGSMQQQQQQHPPQPSKSNRSGEQRRPKKSTAQPRPEVHVPPRGIGPVVDPNPNDVLSGRGGRINAHAGNVQFRDMVQRHKEAYLSKETKKLEKAHIAAQIVYRIRGMTPAGRFLKEDPDGLWFDIGDAKAIKKGKIQLIGAYRCHMIIQE